MDKPQNNHDDTPQAVEPVPRLALRRLELAKALGISGRKVDELIANRDSGLPILWCGTVPLFPVAQVRKWLREQAMKRHHR
jgi:hypothetical protein